MRLKYSIIIPTKNEEESIAKVICSIPRTIAKSSEIVVVDNSNDMTREIAERLGVKVIHEKKSGKGRAMKTGVKRSKGDILIFLDGDGTDPPAYIPKLLEKLQKANIVFGCRAMKDFKSDDMMTRRIFKLYGASIRPIFQMIGLYVRDPLAGFRVMRRKDWDKLNLKSNGFEIEAEMNVKAIEEEFVIKEVAIPHLKRGGGLGNSKLVTNPKDWIKIMNVVVGYLKRSRLESKPQFQLLKKKINQLLSSKIFL